MLKAAPFITPATGYRIVSGVQIHEIPTPSEAPPPSVSVTVTAEDAPEPDQGHVDALVEAIDRLCRAGMGGSPWPVVDLFPLMRPDHWAAYAREARVPPPDQATRRAVRAAYRARVGYEGPEVKDDLVDEA